MPILKKKGIIFCSILMVFSLTSSARGEYPVFNSSKTFITWHDVALSSEFRSRREDLIDSSLNKFENSTKKKSYRATSNIVQVPSQPRQKSVPPAKPSIPQAYSFPSETKEVRSKVIENTLNEFEMSFEISKITYREPNFMKETGAMYGINARYTHHSKTSINKPDFSSFGDPEEEMFTMYRLEGRYSWGSLDYDSQGTGSMEGVKDHIFEARALAGLDVKYDQKTMVTPYLGLGFRYLYDDLRGETTTGAIGYRRKQQYLYLPIGIETDHALSDSVNVKFNVEYDQLLRGRNVTHLEDVDSSFDTLTFAQTRGFGFRTHLNLSTKTEYADFFIQPFFRYWNINDSDTQPVLYGGAVVGSGLEPENNSTEYGIQFGLNF